MNIAVFFAHPDDAEIWAGGTLKKHVDLGDKVTSYMFHELNDIRIAESKQALSILGIRGEYHNTQPYQQPNFENLLKCIEVMPDVVITHWEKDTHIEHQLVFRLSLMLAHFAKRYHKKTPCLLMTSTYGGQGIDTLFSPTIIVDITNEIQSKREAILCHVSQRPENILNDIESQNRILGSQVKTQFAEGFIEYPLFGFKRTALRSNLGDLFINGGG